MPSSEGDINWKAYQTYQDGSVVAWDQAPSDDGHGSQDKSKGPYSVTAVKANAADETAGTQDKGSSSDAALYAISIAALALSILALVKTIKK